MSGYLRAWALAAACVAVGGCATFQKPEDLRVPAAATCFALPAAISFEEKRGLLDIVWEIRLERGPYIAEREDERGTYYRAPPGGTYEGRVDMRDKGPGLFTHITRDGGIWIPRDSGQAPHLYTYYSNDEAPVQVPPEGMDCASFGVVKDPQTAKVSVVAFMTGGAIGGAAGRAMVPSSSLSYGGAAIGGAIAMGIVAALINMDVGKIALGNPLKDATFVAKIREAAGRIVPLREVPQQAKP